MTECLHELNVRIRPPRIVALFSTHTTIDAFLKTIKFLSMVRGGRFARFVFIDMHGERMEESLRRAEEDAKSFFPELIVVPAQMEKKLAFHLKIHRPRKEETEILNTVYSPEIIDMSESDFLFLNFNESNIGGLTPWYDVVQQEYKKHPDLKRDNLFFLKIDSSEEFCSFVAAAYGLLPDEITKYLAKKLNAEIHEARVINACDLYQLFTFMARRVSWLDFLNQGIQYISSAWYPPTVVLVEKQQPIRDLCLFWNLQGHLAPGGSDESLLMLREQDIDNPKALHCLAETFCLSEIRSTYGFLRSAGKNRTVLQKAARRVRSRIALIKDKEYCLDATAEFSMPIVPCYEQKKTIIISVENQEVTVPKVDPAYLNPSAFFRYYCDLVSKHKTTRYPFDLALPKDSDIFLLLNLPGRHYSFQNIVGFGKEFLSIAFTGDEEKNAVKFQLPSEHEIFQVILDRTGCILKKDEKNIRYSKTLDLFPDFNTACIALTGKCWDIIKALESESLTYDKLLGKAKIGKSKISEQFPETAKYILEQYRWVFQEISKNRVGDALKNLLRKESTTENILDYLNQIKVIHRKWLLDKCQSCDQEYWLDTIDITSPIMCPGCGNQIVITDRVRIGYELNQLVRLAVFKEGMRPVVLTARFLRSLTNHGFIWYPGSKVKQGEIETDFDLLACGDGVLIAGECKDLSEKTKGADSAIWNNLAEQLKYPLSIAKECGFKLFFVSSFAERYPEDFKKRLQSMAGDSLKMLFITKEDLENGYRKYKDEKDKERHLSIYTLMQPKTTPKSKMKNSSKRRRTIDFGWGRISS